MVSWTPIRPSVRGVKVVYAVTAEIRQGDWELTVPRTLLSWGRSRFKSTEETRTILLGTVQQELTRSLEEATAAGGQRGSTAVQAGAGRRDGRVSASTFRLPVLPTSLATGPVSVLTKGGTSLAT